MTATYEFDAKRLERKTYDSNIASCRVLASYSPRRKPLLRPEHRNSVNWFKSWNLWPLRFLQTVLVCVCFTSSSVISISQVAVQYKEGLTHGFLALSTLDGTVIARGDMLQLVHGDRVTNYLIFHFKDGSVQEETTIFSQRHAFRLISYHLVQKGTTFPEPADATITVSTGQVTVHYTDRDGKEKDENEHQKLPADLANGLVLTMLKNVKRDAPVPELSMIVFTPKPRLVKLVITVQGDDPFLLVGSTHKALHYVIKIKLGGLSGVIAPLLGKEPPDAHVWILDEEAPTFVKSETPFFSEDLYGEWN